MLFKRSSFQQQMQSVQVQQINLKNFRILTQIITKNIQTAVKKVAMRTKSKETKITLEI